MSLSAHPVAITPGAVLAQMFSGFGFCVVDMHWGRMSLGPHDPRPSLRVAMSSPLSASRSFSLFAFSSLRLGEPMGGVVYVNKGFCGPMPAASSGSWWVCV